MARKRIRKGGIAPHLTVATSPAGGGGDCGNCEGEFCLEYASNSELSLMRLVVDLVKAIPAAKPLLAPLAEGLVESFRLRAARQASQAEVQDEARAVDPLTAVMSALSDHPDQQLAAIVAKFLEGHREPA